MPPTRASASVPLPRAASAERLALLALFVGAIVVGFLGTFLRWSETGPMATGFHRMSIAGVVLWLLPFLPPATKTDDAGKVSRRDAAAGGRA